MDEPAQPPAAHSGPLPWVKLRAASATANLYKRMIAQADPKARAGDLVAVYDKAGAPYGVALYNPKSLITLRLLSRELAGFDPEEFFAKRLARAVELRRSLLRLDEVADAYRVVYDLGDGLPGLVVDRYGDFIVLELYSLAMFRQAERLERLLAAHYPGARFVRRASEHTESMEGFSIPAGPPTVTRVREHGVLFEVDLTGGHKTGFFCDQRDNRLAVCRLAGGRTVLDVCAYTGGFGLYAAKLGGAQAVTCVELDPEACRLIAKNARLNGVELETVCVDAFPYLRQMAANRRTFDLVVLDPYKMIASREGYKLGRQKYVDLNRLALSVISEGGILVTCSCSGMLSWDEFQACLRTAAGSARRRVEVFRKTGAGPDHPVAADSPEGEYLKALWCRVL
ncbi:MAG: class I SAM-dependent rRNA methyltransferase [Elusimicrobia bacterium]|nr:class I SAM-dependent rRNA methyltransferase [Elusimicrobiota bacterium]